MDALRDAASPNSPGAKRRHAAVAGIVGYPIQAPCGHHLAFEKHRNEVLAIAVFDEVVPRQFTQEVWVPSGAADRKPWIDNDSGDMQSVEVRPAISASYL